MEKVSTQMNVRGFTLFHLVASALFFSISLSIGFPLLYSYMQTTRLHNASNTLTTAFVGARLEAVNKTRPVIVCSSIDGHVCDEKGAWEQGIIYFVDDDMNGFMNGSEHALRSFPALHSGTTIRSSFPNSYQVVYLPSGRVQSTDKFNVCINTVAESGRSVELFITGRPESHAGASQCPSAPLDASSLVAQQ